MARHGKTGECAARQREILGVALRLMHEKGYERMTIPGVLPDLQMSNTRPSNSGHGTRPARVAPLGVTAPGGGSPVHAARGGPEVIDTLLGTLVLVPGDQATAVATRTRWEPHDPDFRPEKMTQ